MRIKNWFEFGLGVLILTLSLLVIAVAFAKGAGAAELRLGAFSLGFTTVMVMAIAVIRADKEGAALMIAGAFGGYLAAFSFHEASRPPVAASEVTFVGCVILVFAFLILRGTFALRRTA